MARSSNPAGSEVYEAAAGMRRNRFNGRMLAVERTPERNRRESGGLRSWRLVIGIVRCGSGLVWQASGLRRCGRRVVQDCPWKGDGAVDRHDRGTCMHGGTERRPMGSKTLE